MRYAAIALSLLFFPLISARAQISVGIGFPGVNIGINVSAYPHLVPVPGYPAAPQDRARESRNAPKDKGRENESAPKDRNRENRNDEHGPAPR